MKQSVRLALVVAIVMTSAAAGMLLSRGLGTRPPPELAQGTALPSPRPLPVFHLVDQDGRPFLAGDLRGHWSILFFGFTSCPDACPTTLAALAQARKALADLPGPDQPAVVLVSVDPGRDTPAKLKGYVEYFDPTFRGVTGTTAALDALTQAMGVAVQVGPPDENGNYTVDHTSTLFVIGPSGQLVALLSSPHTPQSIAGDFRRLVAAAG